MHRGIFITPCDLPMVIFYSGRKLVEIYRHSIGFIMGDRANTRIDKD